jgi:hypothetical protein
MVFIDPSVSSRLALQADSSDENGDPFMDISGYPHKVRHFIR